MGKKNDDRKRENILKKLTIFMMFQHSIAMDRREKGIRPEIPDGEERQKLKEEYLKSYKKPVIHIKIKS